MALAAVSQMKREDEAFRLDLDIPANTTATVYVPARARADVSESGSPMEKASGVRFLRMDNGKAVLSVDS